MSDRWKSDELTEDEKDDKSAKVYSSGKKRMIFLYGDINEKNCADIAFDIHCQNIEDDESESHEKDFVRKPIRLYINSFGGEVYPMWMLISAIENSKTPVYTYCTGYAMSAAFQIFLAGQKRYISKHATLMYHQIHCWRSGKYQDLVDDREHMDFLNSQIEEFVLEKTTLSHEEINTIREMKRDAYFSSKDAVEKGMAELLEENGT